VEDFARPFLWASIILGRFNFNVFFKPVEARAPPPWRAIAKTGMAVAARLILMGAVITMHHNGERQVAYLSAVQNGIEYAVETVTYLFGVDAGSHRFGDLAQLRQALPE